jgi:hypothetical protein
MKYILFLCLLIARQHTISYGQQNSLAAYTGKYQMTVNGSPVYIMVSEENGDLKLTSLWDDKHNVLKHLSSDNFIMQVKDWSVKFTRDKKGNVIQVLVMGTDLWTKVNN